MSKLYKLLSVIKHSYYNIFINPKKFPKINDTEPKMQIRSIRDTAKELAFSNKSLGRFGDGELVWMLGRNIHNSFEEPSHYLSSELSKVLISKDKDFMIGLPDAFLSFKEFTKNAKLFWQTFFIKYYKRIVPYLNSNKIYYNTNVTRPYSDYNTRLIAKETFHLLRKVWNNKKILIIEGKESRLGCNDGLFSNANIIRRIECPITNASRSIDKILSKSQNFLQNHSDFITLISLGPSATILAYKLYKLGYRAIDIGHIDIEYNWFLIGAKDKINLPYRYVNEASNGHSALPVLNKKYKNQILYIIN